MRNRLISPIIQLISILIYLILFIGNLNLIIFIIPLSIFFLLFIPGYNLISLLFPKFSIKLKIGLCPIFSLGLEISLLLIYYIFGVILYGSPFFFDFNFVVIVFALISSLLIMVYIFKTHNEEIKSNNSNVKIEKSRINFQINIFYIILFALFIILLILLCLNVYSNRVFLTRAEIHGQYSENFTFFYSCDLLFYFLYAAVIIILVYFAFKLKNKFIFVSCICLFFYVQLILPYLQIGDLFVYDAQFLEESILFYNNYGLTPIEGFGLTVITNPNTNSIYELRYATSTFFGILLNNLSRMDLFFSLSFLYPLCISFTPFLLYGFFEYVFNKEDKNDNLLKILTILSIFNPIFLKLGHTPTTSVIGFNIFIILIFYLYVIFQKQELSIKNMIIILFMYFFLNLTHTEEALYFLPIFLVIEFFYISFKEEKLTQSDFFSKRIGQNIFIKKYCVLFGVFVLIFYVIQEFFGFFSTYVSFFNNIPGFNFIYNFYLESKILSFPFIGIDFIYLSYIVILLCIVSSILCYFIFYLVIFFKSKLVNIGEKIYKILVKINLFFNKSRNKRIFQLFIIFFLFGTIVFIHFFIERFLMSKELSFIIFEIIFIYFYYIIQIYIFLINILFYKLDRINERFFLVIIFTMFFSFIIFTLSAADIGYILYELQKFIYSIIFLNMFLINENFLKDLKKNKYKFFLIIFIITIFGGLNISFRKLRFG